MKSLVVAIGKNREMGQDGAMPWGHGLRTDLTRFKKLTKGKSVIMGRKTFESIGSKPLPNRQNIVVTRKPTGIKSVLSASSLEAAYTVSQYDQVVMGGARLYEEALDSVDVLYVTEVQAVFPEADVYFPLIDTDVWKESERESHVADENNSVAFDFVTYIRHDQAR